MGNAAKRFCAPSFYRQSKSFQTVGKRKYLRIFVNSTNLNIKSRNMMKKQILLFVVLSFLGLGLTASAAAPARTECLLVDMKSNPEGIESLRPLFSWTIASDARDVTQTAYRIQVATSEADLKRGRNLVWDSGEVISDRSILVEYEGQTLRSRTQYFWRVKVDTNLGQGRWSDINHWSMGILDAAEWQAEWIGENALSNKGETDQGNTRLAARYLRKTFDVEGKVKRAVLYISGLGSSESYINGERISDDVLSPTPSLYSTRVYYNVYDVTDMLDKGGNVLGVMLGNGRYFTMRAGGFMHFGLPSLLARLEIEYADGTTEAVVSDTSWRVTSRGPIVANNEFDGEEYDARLELTGWSTTQYDDSAWKQADRMKDPGGKLHAQPNPNITIQDEIKPLSVTARADGKIIVDMGQNMVGWLGVSFNGRAGKPVTMRFAEILNPDSTLYTANLRSARATDIYTPARDGAFEWHPTFTYHGFRYVEIDGLDYTPSTDDMTGYVIYDAMPTTGTFESSIPLLDRIHRNAYWGIRGNYRGMPTDCPQRDERLGWLGDRATGSYGEAYIFKNAMVYDKWLQDIEDSSSPEGCLSSVSPRYWTLYNNEVTWSSAFFYCADMLYQHYGDDRAIRRHYDAMKKWVEYTCEHSMRDGVIVNDTYGDWCMPPESQTLIHSQDPARKTAGPILSTTVFYDILQRMARFARICGKEQDVEGYLQLAERIKKAYNEQFFDRETARYGNNTVTGNLLSLRLGLVPEGYERRVFDNIVNKTEVELGGHVSTGVLGVQHLMRGLTEYGRKDLALRIATNEDYPSWGYMIAKDATTIWELWNGDTADPAMNSANHVMLLGDLIIWYYEDLAGIKCADGSRAFKKIDMSPAFPEGLDHVKATHDSSYGTIVSDWSRNGGSFEWNVTVPCNTTATLRIPKAFGVKATAGDGIHSVKEQGNDLVIEIGSGSYRFTSEK